MTEEQADRMDEEKDQTEKGPIGEEKEEIIEGEVIDESKPENGAGAAAEGTRDAAALAEELQRAEARAKEYFDGWQRERADFSNYKRRVERDQQLVMQSMKGEIIKKYLTILDDLERALKVRPTDGYEGSWASGIELIYRKMYSILEQEGVQRIPAETEEFNPNRHEAISHEDSPDHESGQIIEVVQQGYTLGDRVLRPALVRVAR